MVAPMGDPTAPAVETVSAEAMREDCAKFARKWLEKWGDDLAATRESYIDAQRTGKHNGRPISKEFAKQSAAMFRERSEAVFDCGALLEKDLLSLRGKS